MKQTDENVKTDWNITWTYIGASLWQYVIKNLYTNIRIYYIIISVNFYYMFRSPIVVIFKYSSMRKLYYKDNQSNVQTQSIKF